MHKVYYAVDPFSIHLNIHPIRLPGTTTYLMYVYLTRVGGLAGGLSRLIYICVCSSLYLY